MTTRRVAAAAVALVCTVSAVLLAVAHRYFATAFAGTAGIAMTAAGMAAAAFAMVKGMPVRRDRPGRDAF